MPLNTVNCMLCKHASSDVFFYSFPLSFSEVGTVWEFSPFLSNVLNKSVLDDIAGNSISRKYQKNGFYSLISIMSANISAFCASNQHKPVDFCCCMRNKQDVFISK